jgi:peptide/nickel transport system substrate-binding protein
MQSSDPVEVISSELDPRPSSVERPRRACRSLKAAAVVSMVAVASGSVVAARATTGAAASGSHVLTTAITADLSPLDPDTYYEAQGLPITQGTYQTLVTYAPNSSKLVPALATSWQEARNGLTYTFHLRRGVRFSDGTPFNAAAAEASFERRTAMKAGPSYMTAPIKSYSTPGPYTLVIHMKAPTAPFLDYLASPYGPLMSSPAGVKRHAVSGDNASHWLATHSDGTGPYVLSSVKPGVVYTLTANPYYWGPKPYYTTVNFDVVPTPEQEILELQNGQLNMIFGQEVSTRDLDSLAQNPQLSVQKFPALYEQDVWINPASHVFGSPAMRAALRAGLNDKTLTAQSYGSYGVPSTNVYPNGMLPNGAAVNAPTYNPAKLKSALAHYKGDSITIGWYNESKDEQTLADLIQVELQADGLNATVREYPAAELFNLPTTPRQRPDVMLAAFNPDAAAPDTWARIYWHKNAAVNLLGCTAPKADAALDAALHQPNSAAALHEEIIAADAYRDSNCWLNIANGDDTLVVDKNITGFVHELPWVLTIQLATLHPRG